jgi:hypothetical protein
MSDKPDEATSKVHLPEPPLAKADRERRAFFRLLPSLLATHHGLYVAIHDEQVVDTGTDPLELARRVWQRVGKTDIYIGLVSEDPEPICRPGRARDVVLWSTQW